MLLSATIATPLAGSLLVLAIGRLRSADAARWVALTAAVLSALQAARVAFGIGAGGLSEAVGVQGARFWHLAADGLSAPLVVLTGLLAVVAVLASWRLGSAPHFALVLGLTAAVQAVFLAADLIAFYVAWEAVLIPMYFLIGVWGHEDRRRAAMKFFVYTFSGSVLMLAGILLLMAETRSATFDAAFAAGLSPAAQTLVFWLLAAGFLVKVPVFPLHTWLPDAHVEAPTAGSVLLAGVLLKLGPYALLRVGLQAAPVAFEAARPALAVLGVIGVVYGAAMAFAQSDLKRLVAYSSIAHMGFVMLAVAAGTPLGIAGALIGMVSHGLVAALLFLLVGSLYDRTGTRDTARLGGLGARWPAWATAFVFAALASAGLPGLSGFPGEFVAIVEGFAAFGWLAAAAAAGAFLGAAYNIRAVRRVCHGEAAEPGLVAEIPVLRGHEVAAIFILAAGIVAVGLWPGVVSGAGSAAMESLASTWAVGP